MKRLAVVVGIGALAALAGMMTAAAEMAAQTAGMSGLQHMSGKIATFDAQRGTLKVAPLTQPAQAAAQEPVTFFLASNTVISKGPQHLKPEELKAGDRVMIDYVTQHGRKMANSITVQPPGDQAGASGGDKTSPAQPSRELRSFDTPSER